MLKLKFACTAVTALALLASANFALASDKPTSDQIIQALTPKKPLTRSLSLSPTDTAKTAEERNFVNSLRKRTTRSLSFDEREKIAAIVQDQPSIDLEIRFNFNSAVIARTALADVEALGKALSSPALKGSTFVLSGHTDAVGGESVNLDLSNRRADAVKRVLVEKYGISPDNVLTVGYGKSRLKNASDPFAAENRRVQVTNMADKVAEK